MTRRTTIQLLLGSSALAAAPAAARIKVDTDRVIGEVHPHIFGNFAEHLGRCVYGGIYDPGNPLSDGDGFRKDVMQAVRELGVSLLRWPGGNFVSGYDWKDGIGPQAQRPPRPDHAWGALESNQFGTDEFLRYCERVGTEPYICINAGLGSIDDARAWVEYCNESRDTHWARKRRANGRELPWNVKYWGLGNEIDGPWQLGFKSAEDYTKFALEAAKAMRRQDPSIKLIAAGSSNFRPGTDWIGWNRAVLAKLKDQADYLSLHTYVKPRGDKPLEEFLSASRELDSRIEIVQGLIREAQTGEANPRPIAIAFDEWNVCCRTAPANDLEVSKTGLEDRYAFEDALAMGIFLNSFIRHANVVKMANLAQLVNAIAPIMTSKSGLFRQPIFFPIAEYGKQRGNQSLDLLVRAPASASSGGGLPVLDVSGTWNAASHDLVINVVNRSAEKDIATQIELAEGRLEQKVNVWQMNSPDMKATHDFGSDRTLQPTISAASGPASPRLFSYSFPKASLTMLRFHVTE